MGLFSKLKSGMSTFVFGELIAKVGSARLEEDSDYALTLAIRKRSKSAPHLQMDFGSAERSSSYQLTRLQDAIPLFERVATRLQQPIPMPQEKLPGATVPKGFFAGIQQKLSHSIFGEIIADLGEMEMDDHGRRLNLSLRRFPNKTAFLYLKIISTGDSFSLQTDAFAPLAQLLQRAATEMRRHAR